MRILSFSHNSKVKEGEPTWGSVNKSALPDIAFADRENRKYPHHFVSGGTERDDKGRWKNGTLYLHKGGLNAAWAAANGARSGQEATEAVKSHLQAHRRALGLDKDEDGKESRAVNPMFAGMFGNRAGAPPAIRVQDEDPEEGHIYLYDAIGGWYGINSKDFVQQLMAMKQPTIHLHVNSPGGDVFEARAIQAAIRSHPSKIVSHIDGLAASAASLVALTPGEVEMNRGAFLMIHNSHALCVGDCHDMTGMADTLSKVDDSIAHDYASRTGIDPDEIHDMMDDETWLDCDDALDKGFVDRVFEGEKPGNRFDLSVYGKVPETLSNPGAAPEDDAPAYDHAEQERRLKLIELGCK